jgi:hypothetical protein
MPSTAMQGAFSYLPTERWSRHRITGQEANMTEDTMKRRQLRAMQHAREANVAALLTAFAIGMVVFQVFGQ